MAKERGQEPITRADQLPDGLQKGEPWFLSREALSQSREFLIQPIDSQAYDPAKERSLRLELGGKGTHLLRAESLALPVPEGFILSIQFWRQYAKAREEPEQWLSEGATGALTTALTKLEQQTGRSLNNPEKPLFLSVRSSPVVSMPGVMETVLNVGINDQTVTVLGKSIGESAACQAYFALIKKFFQFSVSPEQRSALNVLKVRTLEEAGVASINQLQPEQAKQLVNQAKEKFEQLTGQSFPQSPQKQFEQALAVVLDSWFAPEAESYRRANNIFPLLGTGVVVQAMVFGNTSKSSAPELQSGSAVLLTRNPQNLDREPIITFAPSAQGTAVVGEQARESIPITLLPETIKEQVEAIIETYTTYGEQRPLDIELTIDGQGKVWVLQERPAIMSPLAKFRYLNQQVERGRLTPLEAQAMISPSQLSALLEPPLDPEAVQTAIQTDRLLETGQAIALGHASGQLVLSLEEAKNLTGQPVVLNCPLTSQRILAIPDNVVGVVATNGSLGSHIARQAETLGLEKGIPVIFGVDLSSHQEKTITISGSNGHIFSGEIPPAENGNGDELTPKEIATIKEWLTARRQNPWLYVANPEKVAQILNEKSQELNQATELWRSHKAQEYALFELLIPSEAREDYQPFKPDEEEKIKTRLGEVLANGNDASLRTGHQPHLPAGGPWKLISSMEGVEEIFQDGSYEKLCQPIVDQKTGEIYQMTEVLVGSFPRGKLKQELAHQHCTWTIAINPEGMIIVQIRPGSAYLRDHEQASPEELITITLDPDDQLPSCSKITIGENIEDDQKTESFLNLIIGRFLKYWDQWGIKEALAIIGQLFPPPSHGIPVLEGQARIINSEPDQKEWCLAYGFKVDKMR